MTRATAMRVVAMLAAGVAGLLFMNSLAPLQGPTVLAYTGIFAVGWGVVAAILPRSWSGFGKRRYALAAGLILGGVLFAAGTSWPARSVSARGASSRLDDLMPVYQFHERHEILIQAPPERVRKALDEVSFADIGVMQTLGRIRNAAMGQLRTPKGGGVSPALPIVEMVKNPRSGFFPLDDSPREFVFGLAGQPWANRGYRLTAEQFRAWAEPGCVKIAANFRIEAADPGWTRAITETRVAANDAFARRKMARYWALIYPGSGMIRRGLLQAIRERAERP